MKDFERLLNNLNSLDLNDIFLAMWRRNDVQDYIIELNTEGEPTSQLYELGIDSLGKSLGDSSPFGGYSPYTKQIKASKGQRIDHITLKDTGEFYKSFKVTPNKKGFRITANPIKEDSNLFQDFGVDIVGLTKENVFKLLDFIEPMFSKEFERRLFQ
jgi:hypothetical protein